MTRMFRKTGAKNLGQCVSVASHTLSGVRSLSSLDERALREGVFTLGDAQSFSELTSKIPPWGSMLII